MKNISGTPIREAVVTLLRRIELYLRRTGTTATRFGREAAGDPCLVFDLRRGRQPRPRSEARISAYLDAKERSELDSRRDAETQRSRRH